MTIFISYLIVTTVILFILFCYKTLLFLNESLSINVVASLFLIHFSMIVVYIAYMNKKIKKIRDSDNVKRIRENIIESIEKRKKQFNNLNNNDVTGDNKHE